jgi:hypothetical protein
MDIRVILIAKWNNGSSSSVDMTSSAVSAGGFSAPAGIGAVEGELASSEGALSQGRLFALSEPAVMLLFGVGLVGLAQLVRKKAGANRYKEGRDQAEPGSRR